MIGSIYPRVNIGGYIIIFPYIERFVAHYLFYLSLRVSNLCDLTQGCSFQTLIYHY